MLHTKTPGKSFINSAEYRDKVLGCWTGKNIGGTLGGPMEGAREMFDISFYTQELKGNPAPNDDLDLQLVWLRAIGERGVYNINERVLGEYWLAYITGPWDEYGTGKFNLMNGLLPPLSGLCNNEQWMNSNGAWIRSEIWACLFPGEPDETLAFAWMDACVDHADEGIYAELFTASLESAAFIESDVNRLIEIALLRIPSACRVAKCVRSALREFEAGNDWRSVRDRIVGENVDLGWFQAPVNIAFLVIGLLWGRGNFGRSVCIAVNCGDDTDCTAATCGAVLGIILGRSGIPREWVEPIGERIKTIAVNPFRLELSETLDELTDRVITCKRETDFANPALVRLTEGKTVIDEEVRRLLTDSTNAERELAGRSSRALKFDLPYGRLTVEYGKSPVTTPGERQKLRLSFFNRFSDCAPLCVSWRLPEGWDIAPGREHQLMSRAEYYHSLEIEIQAGIFERSMAFVVMEVRLAGREYPSFLTLPFRLAGSVQCGNAQPEQVYWNAENRRKARELALK